MDGFLTYDKMELENVKYNPQKTPGKPYKVKAHKTKKMFMDKKKSQNTKTQQETDTQKAL